MHKAIRKHHTPVRRCVICRTSFPKSELKRYVCTQTESGELIPVFDEKQVMPGRGYYICNSPKCEKRFAKFRGWRK
ncbi:YlxR family protein [Halodesulfovibrio sp.]|uniref:YlxR family protein n=1 Tax=Halodesulfovibrio sp. TaxID=1912772 RepID=UPI0025F9AB51|nr:YlxR family protein [Halodesulfovibrio sp.]MCT4625558.1 YlxR family protein [Halodesulfovibrio sp.]